MAGNTQGRAARRWNGWRIAGWGAAAALLLLPAVAMRVTDEVAWGPEDFVVAAVLLGGVGLAFELAVRMTRSSAYRAGAAVALVTAFALIWVNLAVGVIGSEDNPANLAYAGVLAVGIFGAIVARFRPKGMALTMVATALAQALVAVIALAAGWGSAVLITLFFAALWLTSAWLFRKAGTEAQPRAA